LPTQPTENEFWRALKLVELDSWVNNLPNQERTWIGADGVMPSGGQWRRLAIARLVLQQPILALLDEPTEGLEESLAIRLMERLVDEFKDRILIVVSHRDEAIRFIPHELTLDT
jgi:ABC-type transport system involved in cytochrome bd biosynthesis fused ATPase/permease subunit